jgi:hypothetical protein
MIYVRLGNLTVIDIVGESFSSTLYYTNKTHNELVDILIHNTNIINNPVVIIDKRDGGVEFKNILEGRVKAKVL